MIKYCLLIILLITGCDQWNEKKDVQIYKDAKFSFSFEYPKSWRIISENSPTENGEIRIGIISPSGITCAATILNLEFQLAKSDFDDENKKSELSKHLAYQILDSAYSDEKRKMKIHSNSAQLEKSGFQINLTTSKESGKKGSAFDIYSKGVHYFPFDKKLVINFMIYYPDFYKNKNELYTILNSFKYNS